MYKTRFAIAAALALAGCVAVPRTPPPAPGAPRFDALHFFAGHTEGAARVSIAFRGAHAVAVHGQGVMGPDGVLALDQVVEEEGKPARTRHWRIREIAPNRYAGSLTDASGPVSGEVDGARLHLAFPMKGGFAAEQRLVMAADGRSCSNVLTVSKFGLTVAALSETIRKLD